MAKLIAPVCLAACLMVALTGIVRANDEVSYSDEAVIENVDAKVEAAVTIKTIEAIEAIEGSKRTRDQWETLAKHSIEMLSKPGASKMLFDRVKKYMGTLMEAKQYVTLADLGMPSQWTNLFTVQEKSRECTKDMIATVAQYSFKVPKWQHKYVLEYFGKNLEDCGHEQHYERAVGNFPEFNSEEYPTLISYLGGEFLNHKYTRVEQITEGLDQTLAIFKELAGDEPNCNNQQLVDNFANVLFGSEVIYEELNKLIKNYAELYLDHCEADKSLDQAMAEHGVAPGKGESSLDRYLNSKFGQELVQNDKSHAKAVVFALQLVNDFRSNKTGCNPVVHYIKRGLANSYKQNFYSGYEEHFSEVFEAHSAACVDEFKAKAKTFGQEHSGELAFIEDLAKAIGNEAKKGKLEQSRIVIENLLQYLIHDIEHNEGDKYHIDTEDFVENFSNSCKTLFKHMEPTIEDVSYNYNKAIMDKEVRDFLNIAGYCSFQGGIKTSVKAMFTNLNLPNQLEGAVLSE